MKSKKKSILKGYKIPKQRDRRVSLPSEYTSSEDVSTSYDSPDNHSSGLLMSCIHESPPTQFHSLTSNQINVANQTSVADVRSLEASTPKVRFAEVGGTPVFVEPKVSNSGATETLSAARKNNNFEKKSNRKHSSIYFDQLQSKYTHSDGNLKENKHDSAGHCELKRFEPDAALVHNINDPTTDWASVDIVDVSESRGDHIDLRLKSLQTFKSAYFSYHPEDDAYSKLKEIRHNGDCGDYAQQHIRIPQVWPSNITSSDDTDPYRNSTTLKTHILNMHSIRDNATDETSVPSYKPFSSANSPLARQPTYEFYEEVTNSKSSDSSLESDKSATRFIPSNKPSHLQTKTINSEYSRVLDNVINKSSSSLLTKKINKSSSSLSSKRVDQLSSLISTKLINKSHSSDSTNIINTPSSSVLPKENSISWTCSAPPPNVNMSSLADSHVDAVPDQKISQEIKGRQNVTRNMSGIDSHLSSFTSNRRQSCRVLKNNRNDESNTQSFLDCDQNTASFHALPKLNDRLSVYNGASFCSYSDCKLCKSLSNVKMPPKVANVGVCNNFLSIFYAVVIIVGTLICAIGLCIAVTGGFHTSFQMGCNGLPNVFRLQLDVNVDNLKDTIKDPRPLQGHIINGAHSGQKRVGTMFTNTTRIDEVNKTIKMQASGRDDIRVKEHVDQTKQTFKPIPKPIMPVNKVSETTQETPKTKRVKVDAPKRIIKESVELQPSKNTVKNTMKKPIADQHPTPENIKRDQTGSVLPKGENTRWPERFTSLQGNPAAQVAEILTHRTSEIVTDSFGQLSIKVFNQLSKRLTSSIRKGKCRPLIDFFNKECVLDND